MKVFKCKGCGETDSIVEISLVPRVFPVTPDGLREDAWVGRGGDEAFWEAETILGWGCTNDACPLWQGNWGSPARHHKENSYLKFDRAKDPDEIADIVEDE